MLGGVVTFFYFLYQPYNYSIKDFLNIVKYILYVFLNILKFFIAVIKVILYNISKEVENENITKNKNGISL